MKRRQTMLVLFLAALLVVLFARLLWPPSQRKAAGPAGPAGNLSGAEEKEKAALPKLPQRAGTLELAGFYSGPVAVEEILRLHNSQFPLSDALIARYDGPGADMTAWVSVSPSPAGAALLMGLMVEKMPTSPVFSEKEAFEARGITVHHVTGMGMDHYYFLDGHHVYWLAIRSQSSFEVLLDFLQAL